MVQDISVNNARIAMPQIHERNSSVIMFKMNPTVPALKPNHKIQFCGKELDCGHACTGCKGEETCMPCLEVTCRPADKVTKHDNCGICSSTLSEAPQTELDCGHIFHAGCIRDMLQHRWSTQRITFNFMRCPECQQEMTGSDSVPEIRQELFEMKILKKRLGQEALRELKIDKFDNHPRLHDKTDRFYQKPLEYAIHVSEFYECHRCNVPFFGGYVDCANEMAIDEMFELAQDMEAEQLMCQPCRLIDMGVREQFMCQKHGLRHLQFKCDFCCNAAQFRCRANTYFCEDCHENPNRRNKVNCGGNKNKCPYDIAHHPTKRGVPIAGCMICKSQIQKKNHITFQDRATVFLEAAKEKANTDLLTIVAHKKRNNDAIALAQHSARTSTSSGSRMSMSSASSNSSSQGRLVF